MRAGREGKKSINQISSVQKGNGHKLKTHKIPSEHKNFYFFVFFFCKGAQTLQQVAQGGCRVALCGATQKVMGQHSGQPALADPA